MAKRFHMTADGPRKCTAKPGNCPIPGGELVHGSTAEDAARNFEKLMQHQMVAESQQRANPNTTVIDVRGTQVPLTTTKRIDWSISRSPQEAYASRQRLFHHYEQVAQNRASAKGAVVAGSGEQNIHHPETLTGVSDADRSANEEIYFSPNELSLPKMVVSYGDGSRAIVENPAQPESSRALWFAPGGGIRETRNAEGKLHGVNLIDIPTTSGNLKTVFATFVNGQLHSENGPAVHDMGRGEGYYYRGTPIAGDVFNNIKQTSIKKKISFDEAAKKLGIAGNAMAFMPTQQVRQHQGVPAQQPSQAAMQGGATPNNHLTPQSPPRTAQPHYGAPRGSSVQQSRAKRAPQQQGYVEAPPMPKVLQNDVPNPFRKK